jgi:hypothetical protein
VYLRPFGAPNFGRFAASTFAALNFSTTSLTDVSPVPTNSGLQFVYSGSFHNTPFSTGAQFISKPEFLCWGKFSVSNNTIGDGAIVNLYLDTQGSPTQGTAPNATAKRFTFLSNGIAAVAGQRWFQPVTEWYEENDSVLIPGTTYNIYPTIAAVTGGTATIIEGEIMVLA